MGEPMGDRGEFCLFVMNGLTVGPTLTPTLSVTLTLILTLILTLS